MPERHELVHTILLIEDEPLLRALIVEVLTAAGHTVLAASDGATARSIAERHSGPIPLLISDVALAGGSGPEIAQVIRQSRPKIKALFISGFERSALALRGLLDEDFFLGKPFSPKELSMVVARLLQA